MIKKLLIFIPILLSACVNIPENVSPVTGFDIDQYLGTWYEIARLDHSFERGLERVTAQYSLRDDGGIKVVNKGLDPKKNTWKEVIGKAYFVGDSNLGSLKVSFWGPFYSSYNIIDLDKKKYSYSMVCGPNKSYLWILAREPHMEESLKSELMNRAKALGFETDKMIHVTH
ncbi:MAG: lipocalin family protein [Desulfobacteraceae bacterium]|nr:lipocalin family protein [Desulfobacteraceae bacterium]